MQPQPPVLPEVKPVTQEPTPELKSAETSSSGSPRSAMARAMTALLAGMEKVERKQDSILDALSAEWQIPTLPANNRDAVVQLSFAVADSDGVIDQALIKIPIVGARTPVGCKRVHVQMEESVTALFVRPLMDAMASAVLKWCEQNTQPRLSSQLMIPEGAMPAPEDEPGADATRSDL